MVPVPVSAVLCSGVATLMVYLSSPSSTVSSVLLTMTLKPVSPAGTVTVNWPFTSGVKLAVLPFAYSTVTTVAVSVPKVALPLLRVTVTGVAALELPVRVTSWVKLWPS